MFSDRFITLSVVLSAALSAACALDELAFPPGFRFGVASAAYQVEGAWNTSDKSESIWDRFTHERPGAIADGSSGDVACDSYHRWRDDVRMVKELGVHFYRFSISWARLLPAGVAGPVSEDGARYYTDLIDGLLAAGIEPVVTLYHWDLPQRLQDLGGWTNPLVAEWFGEYARAAFSLFAGRVRTWLTLNEPWVFCDVAYMSGLMAPAVVSEVGAHLCTKHALLAHARAYRIYDEEYRPKYHGSVSLSNHAIWLQAAGHADQELADQLRQYQEGRFSHPIYSAAGGWPPAVERALGEWSAREGYPASVLPPFTQQEKELVRGTFDFYALNFYTAQAVRRARPGEALRPWPLGDAPLFGARLERDPAWTPLQGIFVYYPESLRKQLAWIKQQYGDIPVLITENGRGTAPGLEDWDRIEYYKNYLKQVLLSIKEDGVNVTGYTAWTLMDNFEWISGYSAKFGLFEVELSSPERSRSARLSAHYYARVVRAHSLNVSEEFNTTVSRAGSAPADGTGRYGIVAGAVGVVVLLVLVVGLLAWRARRAARRRRRGADYSAVGGTDHNKQGSGTGQPAPRHTQAL